MRLTDRGGQEYLVVTDAQGRALWLLSPSRQADKALQLSGRQRRKYRQGRRAR